MTDIEKDDRRKFFGPDEEIVYYIEQPTAEDIRGADWQYSKTYTQCLVEGITTSAEMIDILTRRGIIGSEFEQRAVELSQNLGAKITLLETTEDFDVKRELSIETARAREELFQWNQRLNGPMNNTAEQISDDARLEYLTSTMVFNEAGERVWGSFDIYLKEKSQALALRARYEVMLYLQGLDADFIDQTPEAVAMREVELDIIEKAEDVLRAEAVALEEETKKSEGAEEAQATKKTTKKKATSKKK